MKFLAFVFCFYRMVTKTPLALAAEDTVFENSWSQGYYGAAGGNEYDGTFTVERTGQRNGVSDTGPEHPALWAVTSMNNGASGFRATSKNGIDALIGSIVPKGTDEDDTLFVGAESTPTLFVGDNTLNSNGQKNGNSRINHVAIEARGAVKLCGKSSPGDNECTSRAYLYLADGSGDLVVTFGDGATKTLASPRNKGVTLRMHKNGSKVFGTLSATKASIDPRQSTSQYIQLSATTPGNGSSRADQKFSVSPNSDSMMWDFKFDEIGGGSYCTTLLTEDLLDASGFILQEITSVEWTAC